MKKLITIGLILGSIGYASYAVSDMGCDGKSASSGHSRFVDQLQLEPERASQLEEVLSSYKEIGKLYSSNQTDKIPGFIAAKEAELAVILTPEELLQFKESVGEWAKSKKFNFMAFSHNHQPHNHQPQN
jgi:hypothetical protein